MHKPFVLAPVRPLTVVALDYCFIITVTEVTGPAG